VHPALLQLTNGWAVVCTHVALSVRAHARFRAWRIASKSWPSTVSTAQPQASYFMAVFSVMVSVTMCESCTLLES